jgi:glycosyltransferase involved in cell wall biosynthesis
MSHVLVDLVFLTGTKGGMETYVRRLYDAMPADSGHRFSALISREAQGLDLSWFPGDVIPSGIAGDDRIAWARGEVMSVTAWAARLGADLIHAPANVGPVRSRTPIVLTVHDLLPFVHPEWVPGRYAGILRWLVRRAARASSRVLTVSEASKADIVRELRIAPDRVDVVPLAGESAPVAAAGSDESPPLILNIGNRMPHKNGETLLHALALLPEARRPRMAITGGGEDDPLRSLAKRLGIEETVDFVGWVSPSELDRLFARSSLIALPTRFEGFGLPVLEAMSRARPVICSDLPVLREVGGDAAAYVDPTDAPAWARRIDELLGDPAERGAMSVRGAARAAEFSWSRTAELTLGSFQRALNAP